MTNEQLFTILRPHLLRVSGVPELILANPNRPAPIGDYASLQIRQHQDERGQANITRRTLPDNRIEETVKAQVAMTCALEFYRGKAHEYASRILQINKRQDVTWPLFKHNISIRNTGPILDLTALQSNNYEPRARIDLYLWLEESNTYEVNNILGVNASVQSETGATLADVDVILKGA